MFINTAAASSGGVTCMGQLHREVLPVVVKSRLRAAHGHTWAKTFCGVPKGLSTGTRLGSGHVLRLPVQRRLGLLSRPRESMCDAHQGFRYPKHTSAAPLGYPQAAGSPLKRQGCPEAFFLTTPRRKLKKTQNGNLRRAFFLTSPKRKLKKL